MRKAVDRQPFLFYQLAALIPVFNAPAGWTYSLRKNDNKRDQHHTYTKTTLYQHCRKMRVENG